jgi:hypothetical protein
MKRGLLKGLLMQPFFMPEGLQLHESKSKDSVPVRLVLGLLHDSFRAVTAG